VTHWRRTGPSKALLETPRLRVFRDPAVNPGGQEVDYDRVETASLVRVAAVRQGRVAVAEQEHFLLADTILQLPGGQIHPGEDPVAAGQRELSEETGLIGGVWRSHGLVYPMPGLTAAATHLFSAVGAEQGAAHPDVGEADLRIRWLPLHQAAQTTTCAASAALLARLLTPGSLDSDAPCTT
jgi:ADP-ribose pyrophosphatase